MSFSSVLMASSTSKDLKNQKKTLRINTFRITHFVFANSCNIECKYWVVTFKPTVIMGSVRLPVFLIVKNV